MNPDGALLHTYLYFIMLLHSRLLFAKVFIHCGVPLKIVIIFLSKLSYFVIYACSRHFLTVGATVFFSVFL